MDALPAVITENLEGIRALCVKHKVKRLGVFGSAVKGTFDPQKSDLDFVVEFLPQQRAGLHDVSFNLLFDLQDLLGRQIDLVERKNVVNPYFRQVLDLTEFPLYESTAAA
jgi:predicted nucleotidyltransferase